MPPARSTCPRSRASTRRCAARWPAADYFAENDTSIGFDAVWRKTEAVAELREVRNIKPGFKRGLWLGLLNAGLESMLGGATPWTLRNQRDLCRSRSWTNTSRPIVTG